MMRAQAQVQIAVPPLLYVRIPVLKLLKRYFPSHVQIHTLNASFSSSTWLRKFPCLHAHLIPMYPINAATHTNTYHHPNTEPYNSTSSPSSSPSANSFPSPSLSPSANFTLLSL